MNHLKSKQAVRKAHAFLIQFYDSYHLYVYKLAWQYWNRPEDIDDFVQEIWVRLCTHTSKLESMPHEEQLAYISTTIRNTAISLSRKKNHEVSLDEAEWITYNEADILNHILDKKLSTQCFRKVWPTVPQSARELLERKYLLEETDAEIALAIGIGASSVRTYLSRARKTAFAVLQEYKDLLL